MNTLRIAIRSLARRPGLALVAILTLAGGIGVNTALFSVVNSTLLAPLPYEDSAQIVTIQSRDGATGRLTPRITGPDVLALRDQQALFEALSLHRGGELGIRVGERTGFANVLLVNPGYFRVFAMEPSLGRWFESEDERSAVVSAGFAERHFGSAGAALGKAIVLNEKAYDIQAVAAESHSYRRAEVWLPSRWPAATESTTAFNYSVVGRLAAGVNPQVAEQRVRSIALQRDSGERSLAAIPLLDYVTGSSRPTLRFLMGAVTLLLLLCCANIAHLMLARGAGRTREMAVRSALGAGRWRLAGTLMAESLVIGVLGGAAGLLLAAVLLEAIVANAPAALPRLDEIRLDGGAFWFVAAASLVSCLLFGLLPAWRSSAIHGSAALGRGASSTLGAVRLRGAIAVAEIAACFVLGAGACLLLRSFLEAQSADLGFEPEGVMVMYAHAPASTLADHVDAARRLEEIAASMESVPGVIAASAAMGVPTGLYSSHGKFAIEGKHSIDQPALLPSAGFRLTSPGYFRTMGIPLLGGRDFDARDVHGRPMMAIISQSLARQEFGGEDPIGRRIRCGLDSPEWMTIAGVVGDVRQQSPQAQPGPELYMPVRQHPFYGNELQLVVRTRGNRARIESALLERVRTLDARVAVKITTLESMVSGSIAVPRFRTLLTALFAALAMMLAMAGVYGVMSCTVAARTAEFGVRAALGAGRARLLAGILARTLWLTAAGLGIGLGIGIVGGSVFAARAADWFEIHVPTIAMALAAVAAAALAAAMGPALRASRVDPAVALRHDS